MNRAWSSYAKLIITAICLTFVFELGFSLHRRQSALDLPKAPSQAKDHPTILVVGDSVSEQYFPLLGPELEKLGTQANVLPLTGPGLNIESARIQIDQFLMKYPPPDMVLTMLGLQVEQKLPSQKAQLFLVTLVKDRAADLLRKISTSIDQGKIFLARRRNTIPGCREPAFQSQTQRLLLDLLLYPFETLSQDQWEFIEELEKMWPRCHDDQDLYTTMAILRAKQNRWRSAELFSTELTENKDLLKAYLLFIDDKPEEAYRQLNLASRLPPSARLLRFRLERRLGLATSPPEPPAGDNEFKSRILAIKAEERLEQDIPEAWEEAVHLLRDLTARRPLFLPYQKSLGLAYLRLGKSAETLNTAERILSLDPNDIFWLEQIFAQSIAEKTPVRGIQFLIHIRSRSSIPRQIDYYLALLEVVRSGDPSPTNRIVKDFPGYQTYADLASLLRRQSHPILADDIFQRGLLAPDKDMPPPLCRSYLNLVRYMESKGLNWFALQYPARPAKPLLNCLGANRSSRVFDSLTALRRAGGSAFSRKNFFETDFTHLSPEGKNIFTQELARWLEKDINHDSREP